MNKYLVLIHHGIEGQKWGKRNVPPYPLVDYKSSKTKKLEKKADLTKDNEDIQKAKISAQKDFEKSYKKNWYKSYNRASRLFNNEIDAINKKYPNVNLDIQNDERNKYLKEVSNTWINIYSNVLLSDFGYEPISSGKDWVNNAPFMDNFLHM